MDPYFGATHPYHKIYKIVVEVVPCCYDENYNIKNIKMSESIQEICI
jgi:hypothetical protein